MSLPEVRSIAPLARTQGSRGGRTERVSCSSHARRSHLRSFARPPHLHGGFVGWGLARLRDSWSARPRSDGRAYLTGGSLGRSQRCPVRLVKPGDGLQPVERSGAHRGQTGAWTWREISPRRTGSSGDVLPLTRHPQKTRHPGEGSGDRMCREGNTRRSSARHLHGVRGAGTADEGGKGVTDSTVGERPDGLPGKHPQSPPDGLLSDPTGKVEPASLEAWP